MIAVVKTGKYAGEEVVVEQWCNDWFSVEGRDFVKTYKPSSLLFTVDDMAYILKDQNVGKLHEWYTPTNKYYYFPDYPNHILGFRKRLPQFV